MSQARRQPGIGWIVGFVETTDDTWIFAFNMDIHKTSELKLRKKVLYEVLKKERIINISEK